jgi:hypothetical protein
VSRVGAALLATAGVIDIVVGIAAVAGAERLEANVREIETSANGGELYFSLGAWGVIFVAAGLILLLAAGALTAARAAGRLTGLVASFTGLAAAFFGLPIFRWPAVAVIVVLLAAAFVLAYGLREPEA